MPKPTPTDKRIRPQSSSGPMANTMMADASVPAEEGTASHGSGLEFLAPPQTDGELGRLAHYRILKELGRGGMGLVFLAEDTQLERQVALKVMLPQFAQAEKSRKRFLREARTAAKLKHDNVITIFQVGEDRGVPFIAMEFLKGAPLDKYLAEKGEVGIGQALRIAREMAEGLRAAHKEGLIHRDIKPANVWLEAPKGRVKILDFGLARDQEDDTHLTKNGAIVGTPAYMAPEQARGEGVDHRSDLFSLGVVFYRLCAGKQPFSGASTIAVLTSLAIDKPTPVREANPKIPALIEPIIDRLLEKDAAKRYQSADEVIAALNAAAKSIAADERNPKEMIVSSTATFAPAPKASPRPASGQASPRKPFLSWPVLCGLAGGLGVLILLGVFYIIRVQNPDGTVTEVKVPEKAKIVIERDGKEILTLPPIKEPTLPTDPLGKGVVTPPVKDPVTPPVKDPVTPPTKVPEPEKKPVDPPMVKKEPPKAKPGAPDNLFRMSKLSLAGGPFKAGDTLTFSAKIENLVKVEVASGVGGTGKNVIGVQQAYVERLGDDPRIAGKSPKTAKIGTKYAAGGSIIMVPAVVPMDFERAIVRTLETNGYVPGKYRYYLEYKPDPAVGGTPQVESMDFELK